MAYRFDATRKRKVSGYSSIGRWYFHLSLWTTHFPCPAAAKSMAGPSQESRSTPLRRFSKPGNARRLVSISLVTSGTNYGEASGHRRRFFRSFNAGLSCRPVRQFSDLFSVIPRAIASSITAAYSIFETTGALPGRLLRSRSAISAGDVDALLWSDELGCCRDRFAYRRKSRPQKRRTGSRAFQHRHDEANPRRAQFIGRLLSGNRRIEDANRTNHRWRLLFSILSRETPLAGFTSTCSIRQVQPIARTLGLETSEGLDGRRQARIDAAAYDAVLA